MDLVIFLALAFGTLATGVTLLAVLNARDGYEDDSGFHGTAADRAETNGSSIRDGSTRPPHSLATVR